MGDSSCYPERGQVCGSQPQAVSNCLPVWDRPHVNVALNKCECVCQEPTAALKANPLLPFNPANPKLQTVCWLFSSGLKKAGSYPEGSLKICWKKEISEQLILTLCSMTFVYNCHGWRGPSHAVTGHHLVYGKKKKVKRYHWNGNSHKLSHLPLTLLYFKTCETVKHESCGHSNKLKAVEVVGRNKHEKAREELLRKQILHLLLLHQRETEGGSRRTECTC